MDCPNPNASDAQTLFRNNCKRERELLRRIRKCLSGVPPPPSFTIPQLDMFGSVLGRREEILGFLQQPSESKTEESELITNGSLFKPTHNLEETQAMAWRDILGVRQHGLL